MRPQVDFDTVQANLSSANDRKHLFTVSYAYDYLHGGVQYLSHPQLKLNDHVRLRTLLELSCSKEDHGKQRSTRSYHGIDIYPLQAGLPWTSGIIYCRQSKHWQVSLNTTRDILDKLATNDSSEESQTTGKSIAEIAQKELASDLEEGWAKFPIYLFPDGDEQRTRLLAALNVFIFVLDDFWEMHDIAVFSPIQRVFISCMRQESMLPDDHRSALQLLIGNKIKEILDLDLVSGNNSGKVLVEQMVQFFCRAPPPDKYNSLRDFLSYRHEDAAVLYILACTKFSLNSSVSLESPRLTKYIHLLKNHVSVANDLASWEKEKSAFDSGKAVYLINTVAVVMELLGLPTVTAAIALTKALQLQMECEIDEEVQRLIDENILTADEWQFIDATLHLISGNVFTSIVMSRYGGQSHRLQ